MTGSAAVPNWISRFVPRSPERISLASMHHWLLST
jgi:hypothetical protein